MSLIKDDLWRKYLTLTLINNSFLKVIVHVKANDHSCVGLQWEANSKALATLAIPACVIFLYSLSNLYICANEFELNCHYIIMEPGSKC